MPQEEKQKLTDEQRREVLREAGRRGAAKAMRMITQEERREWNSSAGRQSWRKPGARQAHSDRMRRVWQLFRAAEAAGLKVGEEGSAQT